MYWTALGLMADIGVFACCVAWMLVFDGQMLAGAAWMVEGAVTVGIVAYRVQREVGRG